ncbi:ABC transporter transmembrane domain-containing protein [Janthinobacterium sp.]|uniref:ABC transporter transmembrane domain-containing protein n=1 Tax=Janthinobacterium sp. TaxID=1871054 RepID=UPI0025866574|nr:ABC transporter transmembrane domain-containing protein [Janthinobacterium sp.]MCX7290246.1 ABC transporter transmembrane domain-containing protein [Janthinobacterium sp.]
MNVFLSLIRRFRVLLLLTSVASVCSALAGIGLISAINQRIAAPAAPGAHWALVFGALLLVLFVCGFASQALLTALGHRVVYEMRLVMLKRVLDTGIERLEQIGAAALYAALTKDVAAIGMAFNRLPFVLYNGVLVLGGFAYLAWLSWQLFLLTILAVGGGALFAQVMMLRMRALMKQVRETDDAIFAGYEGAIEGRCELALNATRKQLFFEQDFTPAAERARQLEVRADRYWIFSLNWGAVLILGLAGLMFVAGDYFAVPAQADASLSLNINNGLISRCCCPAAWRWKRSTAWRSRRIAQASTCSLPPRPWRPACRCCCCRTCNTSIRMRAMNTASAWGPSTCS